MAIELQNLVTNMDEKSLLENLQNFIKHIDKLELEHNQLRETFNDLNQTFDDVIQFQSDALWILEKNGHIHLQNLKAKKLNFLFKALHFDKKEYEFTLKEHSYLIKINKTPHRIIVSATDITEQRRKESLATMGQMAAHLSHEIRNPIGSIALLTSSLLKRAKTENKPTLFEIQKAIFRIERIIQATLMFSKGIKAHKEIFNFYNIVTELENAISYYSYTKDITFNLDFPKTEIKADFELLTMVFSNFLFNAIDAIEEDENVEEGRVQIRYKKESTYCIFTIIDSGVPFINTLELFTAFKSTKHKGNGLGLILSKQIIDCHDGTINLHKGGEKGFEISLPL